MTTVVLLEAGTRGNGEAGDKGILVVAFRCQLQRAFFSVSPYYSFPFFSCSRWVFVRVGGFGRGAVRDGFEALVGVKVG